MRKYQIVYCFVDSKGNVQKDEDGLDQYLMQVIEAYNGGDALEKLKAKEKFLVMPEIIDIREVQKNERII